MVAEGQANASDLHGPLRDLIQRHMQGSSGAQRMGLAAVKFDALVRLCQSCPDMDSGLRLANQLLGLVAEGEILPDDANTLSPGAIKDRFKACAQAAIDDEMRRGNLKADRPQFIDRMPSRTRANTNSPAKSKRREGKS